MQIWRVQRWQGTALVAEGGQDLRSDDITLTTTLSLKKYICSKDKKVHKRGDWVRLTYLTACSTHVTCVVEAFQRSIRRLTLVPKAKTFNWLVTSWVGEARSSISNGIMCLSLFGLHDIWPDWPDWRCRLCHVLSAPKVLLEDQWPMMTLTIPSDPSTFCYPSPRKAHTDSRRTRTTSKDLRW